MNEDTNVQEFFDAFEDTGYQTGDMEVEETAAETEETEQVTEEADREEAAEADKGEAPANEETPTGEKDGAEGSQEPEMFTLKVNKEERRVTREEMVALAQKGSDYDRVKAAAEQAKSDNTALKEQNAKMQEAFDLLAVAGLIPVVDGIAAAADGLQFAVLVVFAVDGVIRVVGM